MKGLDSMLLDQSTLGRLPDRVGRPAYDRSAISTGIVHFGVGAFHRAHQAMYVDRLLALGHNGWGICGVGVLEGDRAMRDALRAQDNLYTLAASAPDGTSEARVIGSIHEYLFAPDDPGAVVDRLAASSTRIVSLTITEGGYSINDATEEFDPRDPLTLRDLEPGGGLPRSVLGLLTAGLARRRAEGTPPFTVMSCDNIQGNGHVARTALTGFAGRKDPALAEWIGREVAFPNSMVARITPATTDATRAWVLAEYGIEDRWPVRCEDFTQWVLEDHFPLGRPPYERAGVQLVQDVLPYELMKLRLLNATHQMMAYPGALAGESLVHDVARDPLFSQLLLDYMHREAMPTLQPVPGIDLDAYCQQLIDRYSNEAIRDTLARLAFDASERIPKFLLPVLRHQLEAGGEFRRCAFTLAAWCRFMEGADELGGPTPINDVRSAELAEAAVADRANPGAFLDVRPVFGDLGADHRLRDTYAGYRAAIAEEGVRAVIARINAG
ncbi:MAG: mannitol dehydrogenase family protein [Chloroflexota bacterium]